jgi:hypothetical protein
MPISPCFLSLIKISEDEGVIEMLLNVIFIICPVLAVGSTVWFVLDFYKSTKSSRYYYLDGELWRYQAACGWLRGTKEYLKTKRQMKYENEKA